MIDSKSISSLFMVVGILLVGVVMAVSVVTNPQGGLAAMVPLIAFILTILGIIKPRAGLYGLAALVIWVDEFKRLAVYFGGTYSMTVHQTLAIPFIVLAGLNAGYFINILFGRVKIDKVGIVLYALGAVVGGTIFVTMEGTIAERGQRAANIAGYVSLIPIAYTYLKTFDEWRRFFAFQCLVALPAAAWAIKQYYMGFDTVEWSYARSGLSMAHYAQMFLFEEPRVFGFFGSASALGCVSIYCAFSWWHSLNYRKFRFMWAAVALVFSYVLVVSTQRGALLYPIVMIPFVFTFRRPFTTLATYVFLGTIFVAGVLSATWLLDEGIEKINRAIASDSEWGQKVLVVSTFSDRLRGWERLSKAENYSLLGTGAQEFTEASRGFDVASSDYNHDIINKILINYGMLGILVIAILAGFAVYVLHNTVYEQQDIRLRKNAAFALALSYPMILLSFVGGDNFNANPINIQIWTALAGVFVCRVQALARIKDAKHARWLEEQERIRLAALREAQPPFATSTTRT